MMAPSAGTGCETPNLPRVQRTAEIYFKKCKRNEKVKRKNVLDH